MPASFDVRVDVCNPGQFFACCALLELAGRLQPTALGWFESGLFKVRQGPSLEELHRLVTGTELRAVDPEDSTASPIHFGGRFGLRIDWWKAEDSLARGLKTWAGTMESFRIARGMRAAMCDMRFASEGLLDVGLVAYDPEDKEKKVEPFYFDARRGPNAHSRDVGFAPNDLKMTTLAFPAVEFLCLVGLQRAKPVPVRDMPRVFDYHTWTKPLPVTLLPVAVAGLVPGCAGAGYRFESWFRTSQRKHKAFLFANPQPPPQAS
jgi:CRISPR-associated protein Csb3